MMPTGTSSRSATLLTAAIAAACSSGVPCERLTRATFMPARTSASIVASSAVAGPRVATILVRRCCARRSVGGLTVGSATGYCASSAARAAASRPVSDSGSMAAAFM